MIKNIFITVLLSLLLWIYKDNIALEEKINEYSKISKVKVIKHTKPIEIIKEKKITKPRIVKTKQDTPRQKRVKKQEYNPLSYLLRNNQFYDALTYYLEHSHEKNRLLIEGYLSTLVHSNPILALEYMQVFLDDVPQSPIESLMIKAYIEQGLYVEALARILQAKENYATEDEENRLSEQYIEVAGKYITVLTEQKAYAKLISFLEEMINMDTNNGFYSFKLAQLYLELDKSSEALALLSELQYDDIYKEQAKKYLDEIDIEKEKDAYDYKIPLKKYAEHYVMDVALNGVQFHLMLDTGATFILVDESKASHFEIIRDDLILQTAGNDIEAQLAKVTLEVGNLQLSNIEITIASFPRRNIDGLLGMNFFKQFTFFIDQEEHILYLNNK